jgi:metallophosphoesterase (TIGR00282 family)
VSHYNILFLGDIVGKPGREGVRKFLPGLLNKHKPLFTIINGENSAGGVGITPDIADDLLAWGADAITLGNHWFNKRDIEGYLNSQKPIVRPGNLHPSVPGRGICFIEKEKIRLAVINLLGRVYMDPADDPFRWIDEKLPELGTPHVFIDFHAEASSEKIGFGWHVDGRVTAVFGTHTHVQTADERILPGGTAYLTDSGMCGPADSVLGMNLDVILRRFRTGMPQRFEVAHGPSVICGAVVSVCRDTGRAAAIERIRLCE